jgi:hypothetical protein
VSVSIFSGNCSGNLDPGTLNHVVIPGVCDEFPIFTSPEGPVFSAYGFVISTGGVCWADTVANCTAIAADLQAVLASDNHGAYAPQRWGCAASAVAGVDECFTVGVADRYSMQTTPVCASSESTTLSSTTSMTTCVCPALWAPVCANGVTYGNTCQAQCTGVDAWSTGECTTTTVAVTTVANVNDTTASTSTSATPTTTPCTIACTANYDPVCSAGTTYSNACEVTRAASCAGEPLPTWTLGECPTLASTTSATTATSSVATSTHHRACAGNVSISFGGTCSGDDGMRTRHNATLEHVCDTFPVQLSPMGPVFLA